MLAFARDAARRAPDSWAVVLPHIEWDLAEENEGLRRSLGTIRTWKAFRGAVKQIGWWLWSEQLG